MAHSNEWESLKSRCEACTICEGLSKEGRLCAYGKPTFGYGKTQDNSIMFVGEAPGEAGCGITGIPFTNDKSGQLFNWILERYGKTMGDIYTTNIVKCCPMRNRTPTRDETRNCAVRYLYEEIKLIKPRRLVALGKTAFNQLQSRGAIYIPHPAYAIRNGAVPGNRAAEIYSLNYKVILCP